MKKFSLASLAVASLVIGFSAFAATKVIITGTPATIEKQGDIYVVPAGTDISANPYFYYTTNGSQYVCTTTAPAQLVSVDGMPLSIQIGGVSQQVQCYPQTNFTIQTPQ